MKSRVKPAILEVLEAAGKKGLTFYQMVNLVFCQAKTAQRTLYELKAEGKVHIPRYERHQHGNREDNTPVFVFGPGKSVPRPPGRTKVEQQAIQRQKHSEVINARKRNARVLANPPKIGIWGI